MTWTTRHSGHYDPAARLVPQDAGLQRHRARWYAAWHPIFPPGRRQALTMTQSGRTTGTWTMKVCIMYLYPRIQSFRTAANLPEC